MLTEALVDSRIDSFKEGLERLDENFLTKFPIEMYIDEIESLPELYLYRDFPFRLTAAFESIRAEYGQPGITLYHKLALASFIKRTIDRLPSTSFSADITGLYYEWFERIVDDFSKQPDEFYDHEQDFFCKDLGVCSMRMTPVGCELTEIAGLSRRHFLSGGIKQFFCYMYRTVIGTRGFHPFYGIHMDMRYLDKFNSDGRDRCFVRVAEMLKANPRIKGLFAVSWFYDPEISRISPRLAYLRERPEKRRARFFKTGSSARDIRLSTLKSPTRKRLYEEGKYRPTGHMMLWNRKDLIAWADKYRKTTPEMAGIAARAEEAIGTLEGELLRITPDVLRKYPIERYSGIVRSYRRRHFYRNTSPKLVAAFDDIEASCGIRGIALYQKTAMAHFIRDSIPILENMGLPEKINKLYGEWFERIIEDFGLMEDEFYDYRKDRFCKDLAVCSLRLVPVGFLVEESGIGSKFLFTGGVGQFIDGLSYTVRQMKGLKPFYSIHLDMRYLRKNFSKEGWIRCYLNIADLLKRYPRIKGMIGGSWFYDPLLEELSPGLAHLRQIPEQNGGRVYPIGTSEQDLRLAAANSPQRTLLIMEGKYKPVHYIIVWPRKGMLEWAEKNRDAYGTDQE